MKLSDKIIELRKQKGMTQEDLAAVLNVSRQAISRWEMGTAMPDASNILQLSKLFKVTADYLLNDDYRSDNDLPKIKEVNSDGIKQIMFFLVVIEIMILLIQFMAVFILQNIVFAFLGFILFLAPLCGFEYAYQKKKNESNEYVESFRKKFYQISVWLGTYFPIRFLSFILVRLYPLPFPYLAFECVILCIYLSVALSLHLTIEKHYITNKAQTK